MLNATTSGCDALVVTQDEVKHIPLPNITIPVIVLLYLIIQKALLPNGRHSLVDDDRFQAFLQRIHTDHRLKGMRIPEVDHTPEDLFKAVLEMLWLTVVRPVIHNLNLKVGRF
jgi:hypothetical protein